MLPIMQLLPIIFTATGDTPASTLSHAETYDGSQDGGNGDGGEERQFTQAEVDRLIGERLARAEDGFRRRHDLDALQTKAAELERVQAELARKDRARKDSDLKRNGDVDKLTEEYDRRLQAKDEAFETAKSVFANYIVDTHARIAATRVADRLHEDAKPLFGSLVRDALGVEIDVENRSFDVFPVGENGHRAYDSNGDPLTVDGVVEGVLNKHAYLVKASGGGSGAAPSRPAGPRSDYQVAHTRARETRTANPWRTCWRISTTGKPTTNPNIVGDGGAIWHSRARQPTARLPPSW